MATKNLNNVRPQIDERRSRRIVQNVLLVWVDSSIDENNEDSKHTLEQLRAVVNEVIIFQQVDDCVQFLKTVKNEKALVITSGSLGQDLILQIHHMTQIDAIYIFCSNPARHQSWAPKWSKVKGVYNWIQPICNALQCSVKQSNEDLTPISFVQSNGQTVSSDNLNRLEPSFMYTQILKRILLEMKHEDHERQAIVKVCRKTYQDNPSELKVVEAFGRDYRPDTAVCWYTRECFTYQMLNRALRCLEGDIIVDMGFFIHDLHRQLEQLHRQQVDQYHGKSFIVFRGQGLSKEAFSKLQKTRRGLMAFNNFLSTSQKRPDSLERARKSATNENMVGILFMMSVDPKINSTPFADIKEYSYFKAEAEVLFSMHSVFRIGEIRVLDAGQRLFEVQLTLTGEDDPELSGLTDCIDKEIEGGTGWQRLGRALLKMGQVNKAEELYLTLLEQKPSQRVEGHYYHCLGSIKDRQGDYKEAVRYYEQALSIKEKILSPTDPKLATSYSCIGTVYLNIGEYSKALSYYEKDLAICLKTLPVNHPSLATSYSCIGTVYLNIGEYSKALSYYEKDLAICQKTLPVNHPSLATSYNNIGAVYLNIGEYLKALSYYNKALGIQQKTLPADHPDLATSYNNIGSTYYNMKEYPKAKSYFQKALNIRQHSLPPNHPDIQISLKWLELVNKKM